MAKAPFRSRANFQVRDALSPAVLKCVRSIFGFLCAGLVFSAVGGGPFQSHSGPSSIDMCAFGIHSRVQAFPGSGFAVRPSGPTVQPQWSRVSLLCGMGNASTMWTRPGTSEQCGTTTRHSPSRARNKAGTTRTLPSGVRSKFLIYPSPVGLPPHTPDLFLPLAGSWACT